jgi:hypothetical protein
MLKAPTIAAGAHIVNDANLAKVSGWLGCKMAQAPDILASDLATAIQTKESVHISRIRQIEKLRDLSGVEEFSHLSELETSIKEFFQSSTKEADDLKNDSLAQLSFMHPELRSLNHLPFILMMTALFKIWVVPAMTLLFPLIAWILPFILLRFVYALPITQDQYMGILRTMWSGNLVNPETMFTEVQTNLLTPKSIAQAAIFMFSFAQSMIQPIQNAMHLYKTDKVFLTIGSKLIELRNRIRVLQTPDFPLSNSLDDLDDDPRRAFILVKEQPERLRVALKSLASLEILWRIAMKPELHPVVFREGPLELKDVVDISLENGVPSSIVLGGVEPGHAVITGPNGGGKSSFMRAVLQAVLLGHAYGCAPAVSAAMPRFKWIASGLQLRDSPGVLSMFETEVRFASAALKQGSGGLVLFDELFHSTNAPDGARTATLFLEQLWASPSMSIVSTHIFPLIEAAPKSVKAICCQATDRPDGVEFSFRVEPGICRVSSVKGVWDRFGLRPRVPGQLLGAKKKDGYPE